VETKHTQKQYTGDILKKTWKLRYTQSWLCERTVNIAIVAFDMNINMGKYPLLQLYTNHCRVFNNEHNSYPKWEWNGLRNICVTDVLEHISFVVVTIPFSFTLSWDITRYATRVSQRMLLVKQKILTFPKHMSSSICWCVRVAQSLVFCAFFCWPLYWVLLRFRLLITPFSIFSWAVLFTSYDKHLVQLSCTLYFLR
jgi:hypothetical protein